MRSASRALMMSSVSGSPENASRSVRRTDGAGAPSSAWNNSGAQRRTPSATLRSSLRPQVVSVMANGTALRSRSS